MVKQNEKKANGSVSWFVSSEFKCLWYVAGNRNFQCAG